MGMKCLARRGPMNKNRIATVAEPCEWSHNSEASVNKVEQCKPGGVGVTERDLPGGISPSACKGKGDYRRER